MKITNATCGTAPIALLYGAEGRGKTTLAAKFPTPVAMLLERGLPAGVKLDAIDGLGAFAAVLESIRSLYADPQGYQTLIIDTLIASSRCCLNTSAPSIAGKISSNRPMARAL